jgi:hypothetical protein
MVMTEAMSSRLGEKKASKRPLCQKQTDGGMGKTLANSWSWTRIMEIPHEGRQKESNWEMSV